MLLRRLAPCKLIAMTKCILLLTGFIIFTLKNVYCLKRALPKCNQPTNIYDNLGCKPTFDSCGKTPKICPACYDCSQIDPQINKCYYRGKYYDIGEYIDDDEPLPTCYASCACQDDLTFTCAIYDCAFPNIPDNCYPTYGLDQCCPTGHVCPNNDTLKCSLEGYEVYEGQTFTNPKDPCSSCECAAGVTGNPGDPHCKKNVCDVELYQSNYILGYCAAVYGQLTDCCPYDYICPRDDDNFITCDSSSTSSVSHSHNDSIGPRVKCNAKNGCKQCRYGKHCYPIGTKFSRRENNILSPTEDWYQETSCECTIPPYFTCTRTFPIPLQQRTK